MKKIKFIDKGPYRYGGYPLPVNESNEAEIPLHLRCSKSIVNDMRVRFKLVGEVIGDENLDAVLSIKCGDGLSNLTANGVEGEMHIFTESEIRTELEKLYDKSTQDISPEPEDTEVEYGKSLDLEFTTSPIMLDTNLTINISNESIELTKSGQINTEVVFTADEIKSKIAESYPNDRYIVTSEVSDVTITAGENNSVSYNIEVLTNLNISATKLNDNTTKNTTLTKQSAIGSEVTWIRSEVANAVGQLFPEVEIIQGGIESEYTTNAGTDLDITVKFSQSGEAKLVLKVNGSTKSTLTSTGTIGESHDFTDQVKEILYVDYPEAEYTFEPELTNIVVNIGEESEFNVVPTAKSE